MSRKKSKRKKKWVHPSERADESVDSTFRGQRAAEHVETRIGEDGVEETHLTIEVLQGRKSFTMPKGYEDIDWTK